MVVSNPCDPDPRVEKEALALASAGYTVTIHAFDREGNRPKEELLNGIPILRYRVGVTPRGAPNLFTGLKVLRGLQRFRRKVAETLESENVDIVHCHDADTLWVGLRVKKKKQAKLVFDMHDLAHTWARMTNPASIIRRIAAFGIERRLIRRLKSCDLVVTSSGSASKTSKPGFREWIRKRSAVDVVVVENRPLSVKEPPPFPERFTIGYIGSIREANMFRTLIDAISIWPENQRPRFVLAGHGTADKKVNQMLVDSDIDYDRFGAFNRHEIGDLISKISVMYAVYPVLRGNILEGALPTKMFDAAAYGRPSVVNSGCLMGDIARAEELGSTVPVGDPLALRNALDKLRQNSTTVTLDRDWSGEAQRLISAYERFGNGS